MKELAELNLPDDLRYAEEHEWARQENASIRVGISDYAQDQLGDITFAELPGAGDTFAKGEEFGNLESTKAVSELFMPIGGEIVEVNEDLAESPELVNEDPYGKGWIILVKPTDPSELESLMTLDKYRTFLEGLE